MSLVDDAIAAQKAGLTYGQYMSTKNHTPYVKRSGKCCKRCGKPLNGYQQYYCSKTCREQMKANNAKGDYFV